MFRRRSRINGMATNPMLPNKRVHVQVSPSSGIFPVRDLLRQLSRPKQKRFVADMVPHALDLSIASHGSDERQNDSLG